MPHALCSMPSPDVPWIAVARPRRWARHLATAGCGIRGAPEWYVAGVDTRGRQERRPYPWSQQVIHGTSGLIKHIEICSRLVYAV